MKNLILSLFAIYRYLKSKGWIKSVITKKNYNPWFTYPFIRFVEPKLNKTLKVFEYGSGASTRWLRGRVGTVISVEHNKNYLQDGVIHKDFPEYQQEVLNHKNLDIVIIDGRQRVACAMNAVKSLNDGGVIIWDNSDREKYNKGYQFLLDRGFKRVDFWGIGDLNACEWCTSVFYKNNNCLGL